MARDRRKNLSKDLQVDSTPKNAWRQAKTLMGQGTNTAPKNIEIDGNLVSNPAKIAEAFSEHHKKKMEDLRKQAPSNSTIRPEDRVRL